MGGDNVDKKQLQGFSVCHSNDVLSKHLTGFQAFLSVF